MRKLLPWCLLPFLLGAAPSRQATYTAGQVISPTDVTSNEDVIYTYLQAGVDTIATGAVTSTGILDGTIANVDISSSAAIGYSKLNLASSIVAGDLSTGAVTTTGILDNTITATDLNATLTFADGDFLNLSAINSSSTTEGLRLPQATSCSSATAEGQACWDTDGDVLYIGTGTAANPQALQTTVISATRTAAAGTGSASYTGVGFQPTALLVNCQNTTGGGNSNSWGFVDDSSGEMDVYVAGATPAYQNDASNSVDNNPAGAGFTANVTSFDSDGFTLSWTIAGAGANTTCVVLALR